MKWPLYLLALAPALAVASPNVTGVSGTITTGQTWTVSGLNFGTKSPAKPLLWADFSSSVNPTSLGVKTSWDGVQNFNWGSAYGKTGGGVQGVTGLNPPAWTLGLNYSYYTTFNQHLYIYRQAKLNFTVTPDSAQPGGVCSSSDCDNFKTLRLWPLGGSGYPNLYFAPNNGQCGVESSPDARGFYSSFNPWTVANVWNTEEIVFKGSSASDVKDGTLDYYVNGALFGGSHASSTTKYLLTRPSVEPGLMATGYPVHFVPANIGRWNPAWNSGNTVNVDNVYVDTSWARVILGNASTYAASNKRCPQPPSAWSSGSITVTSVIPSGDFAAGSSAYLYVIDETGAVSNGFLVLVGGIGGGSTGPAIAFLSPTSGLAAGGTSVDITGSGFAATPGVTFGGVACPSVTFNSAGSLTVTTPAHAAGTVDVVVTNPDTQQGTLFSGYTYTSPPAPSVTSVSPNNGPDTGGTSEAVNGTNFVSGATVKFGTVTASGVSFVNSTRINCTSPGHAPGVVSVTVTNPDTQLGVLAGAFTYNSTAPPPPGPAPTVSSVSPNSGTTAGGTTLTVSGADFVATPAATVGGISAPVTFINSTTLSVVSPAHAAGVVSLVITNPDGQSGTLSNAYTYVAPVVLPPASFHATASSQTTLSWAWSATSPSASSYRMEVSTVSNFSGTITSSTTANLSATVSGLSANATYYGRVYGTVSGTPTAWSSLASTVTWANQPGAGSWTATLATSLTASFALNGNPAGTSYQIDLSSSATFAFGVQQTSVDQPAGGAFSSLLPSTVYYARARARSFGGAWTGYRPTITTQTLNTNAPSALSYLTSTVSSLSASWTASNPAGDTYTFQVATDSGFSSPSSFVSGSPATATGLTVNTTYYGRVKSTVNGVASDYSATVSSGTKANAPASAVWSSVTDTAVTFGWSLNSNPAGTHFLAEVSANSGFSPVLQTKQVDAVTATFTGLTGGTLYYGRVRALSHSGAVTSYVSAGSTATMDAAPVVTSVSPVYGSVSGGITTTVHGHNFRDGDTVDFGGSACTSPTVVDESSITCTTPAHASGYVIVTVSDDAGLTGTRSNGFFYQTPVNEVCPCSGG